VTPEPVLELRSITLHPTPDRRVIGFQAPLVKKLFGIPQRQMSIEGTNERHKG